MVVDRVDMVPGAGIEPARYQIPRDFKSLASTNFATRAFGGFLGLEVDSQVPENGGAGRNRTGVD